MPEHQWLQSAKSPRILEHVSDSSQPGMLSWLSSNIMQLASAAAKWPQFCRRDGTASSPASSAGRKHVDISQRVTSPPPRGMPWPPPWRGWRRGCAACHRDTPRQNRFDCVTGDCELLFLRPWLHLQKHAGRDLQISLLAWAAAIWSFHGSLVGRT